MDGHFQVIVPPAMIGTWNNEAIKYLASNCKDLDGGLVFIIAHAEMGKGFAQVRTHSTGLGGARKKLPRQSAQDCLIKFSETYKKNVYGNKLYGVYAKGIPQQDSSRYVIVTSAKSWESQVHRQWKKERHVYYPGKKAAEAKTQEFQLINPAFVVVDEAHLNTKSYSGHFQVLNDIQSTCEYKLKAIFLTGTPLTKSPEDLKAMLFALQDSNWMEKDHFLNRICNTKIDLMISDFKSVTSSNDPKLADITKQLWGTLHKVMIRRTNDSQWFGANMKTPVKTNHCAVNINIPDEYKTDLSVFHETIKNNLKKNMSVTYEKGKKVEKISDAKIISETRLYQMASSLPFLFKFWADPNHRQYRFQSQEITPYFTQEGEMLPECVLCNYIDTILTTSPKLDYIGRVLDSWGPKDGKLIILTNFVLVAFCATAVYLPSYPLYGL